MTEGGRGAEGQKSGVSSAATSLSRIPPSIVMSPLAYWIRFCLLEPQPFIRVRAAVKDACMTSSTAHIHGPHASRGGWIGVGWDQGDPLRCNLVVFGQRGLSLDDWPECGNKRIPSLAQMEGAQCKSFPCLLSKFSLACDVNIQSLKNSPCPSPFLSLSLPI
jgi:hypothetical protein